MDSAFLWHMTEDKQKFMSLTLFNWGNMTLQCKKATVTRVGMTKGSKSKVLNEVYHVDGLKNIYVVSHLYDKGNKVTFTSIGYKVKKLDTKQIDFISKRQKMCAKLIQGDAKH